MNAKRAVFLCLCLSLAFLSSRSSEAGAPKLHKVGLVRRSFTPPEPYDWRSAKTHALVTDIWYPAEPVAVEQTQWIGSPDNPFASAGKAAPDAAVIAMPEKLPLVLLSHGFGGSSSMMAWLGTALAAHGFIAAAVNHPGNNSLLEPYTLEGGMLWWERARDLSVVLDRMLVDSTFGNRIDPKRIGAAGFSLGGFTVIEIAGGIGELSRLQAFCKSSSADRMCVDPPEFPGLFEKASALARTDFAVQAVLLEGAKSHRDPRIRAIFAIAPAIGPAFDPASLAKISIPTQIVAGSDDKIVPIESSAKFFASHIRGARLTILQDVGHYTFLATCAQLGRTRRPDLCLDNAGILRDDIHAQTANLASDFFQANLK